MGAECCCCPKKLEDSKGEVDNTNEKRDATDIKGETNNDQIAAPDDVKTDFKEADKTLNKTNSLDVTKRSLAVSGEEVKAPQIDTAAAKPN